MASSSSSPMQHTFTPPESSSHTFYPYSENNAPIGHKLEAWCPAADLIALVNYDNKLELYRLSWRLHWSVSVKAPAAACQNLPTGNHRVVLQQQQVGTAPAEVVSLAWRPDGKAIAVGLADGGVNMYDYQDGSLISNILPAGSGSIHCLKWTDIYLGTPNYSSIFGTNNTQKSILKALPLLSPIPPTSAQQQMMERTMFNKNFSGGAGTGVTKAGVNPEERCNVLDEESSPIMNVLFSGDRHGRFMMRLFEGFDMDSVSLPELLKIHGIRHQKDLDILKADMQLDLSEITLVALGTHATEGSDSGSSRRLLQVSLASNLLDNHPQEIRMLGLHKRPLNNLLQYLSDGLQVMKADYKKISQMAESCVESLQQSLTENNVNTTPTYEFIQMLLTGRPSESMGQYLQQDLNTHDLKRWDKAVKAAYKNLQRVAFECLMPACERLLVILSDSLGYSRWTEQYGPLRLDEALIYNCIIIVGDFVGLIESLFQAIKVELKQFTEFENWLEQVLEKLHPPPARGPDDPIDEGPKIFPPVDVKGVSHYLKAGLTNNGLERFFQEADELVASNADQENAELSAGKDGVDEVSVLGYRATPSYPFIYTFSEELRVASALKETNSGNQTSPQKTPTNPFAGAAIAAAMAGRGFGSMPPKKSSSSALFSTSSTSTTQSTKTRLTEGPGSPSRKPMAQLTLERHLKLMTTQCQFIFDAPQRALAESIRVTHVVEVLKCDDVKTDDTEALTVPKFATRYCYHNLFPWHYLVACVGPSASTSDSFLVVLRSRKAIGRTSGGRRKHNETSEVAGQEVDPSVSLQSRKRKVPDTSQKDSAAGSESLVLSKSVDLSPSAGRKGKSAQPGPLITLIEQDLEVAIFSLQEHDSAQAPSKIQTDGFKVQEQSEMLDEGAKKYNNAELGLALAKMQSTESSESQPFFEVRDLTFLDDDSLCVLLNSSRPLAVDSNSGDAGRIQEDQFVVSVPLQSSGRPYQPVPASWASEAPSDNAYEDCLLDRLVHALDARSRGIHSTTSAGANSTITGSFNVYTLPIDRSRCVTPLDGQILMDVDGASRSFSFMKSTMSEVSSNTRPQQQQDSQRQSGPTRIACNDREKGQVISVHTHDKISVLDV
ncbi:Anaphase-promoting complex subunit 4 [Mortierella sp. AD031]|nr:Anaphase-promoting complex subunit 4 [Mortierella sp. AD031]